jgi:hypothetical protein
MKFAKAFSGVLVAVLFLSSPALHAQTITTGDITGTVKDPTGAVVPTATVVLKNVDSGESREASVNIEAGELPDLSHEPWPELRYGCCADYNRAGCEG